MCEGEVERGNNGKSSLFVSLIELLHERPKAGPPSRPHLRTFRGVRRGHLGRFLLRLRRFDAVCAGGAAVPEAVPDAEATRYSSSSGSSSGAVADAVPANAVPAVRGPHPFHRYT